MVIPEAIPIPNRIGEVCIWSGAGISMDSNLPSGHELTKRAVDHWCAPDTWERISRLHNRFYMDIANPRRTPRLEVVLDVLIGAYDEQSVLTGLLGEGDVAPPNDNHKICAGFVEAGAHHITANFDTCIERCFTSSAGRKDAESRVLHFHGRYGDSRLGARLSNIAGGFEPPIAEALDTIVGETALLLVCGYSGSDFFDVDPWLRTVGRRIDCTNLTVVWLTWNPDVPPWSPTPPVAPAARFGAGMQGAKILSYAGPVTPMLRDLASRFNSRMVFAPVPKMNAAVTPSPTLRRRVRATIQLAMAFGDVETVRARAEEFLATSVKETRFADSMLVAEAEQFAGLYKKSLSRLSQLHPANPKERIKVLDRRIATLTISGHWLRARRLSRIAVKETLAARSTEFAFDSRERCLLLESCLMVQRDLERIIPFGVPGKVARRIWRAVLATEDEFRTDPLFVERMVRAREEIRCLRSEPVYPVFEILGTASEVHGEMVSLNGVVTLNRHSVARARRTGNWSQESEQLLVETNRQANELVQRAEIAKTSLLLRAVGVPVPNGRRSIGDVEWSLVLRLGWYLNWILRSTRAMA